jgi:hypothetical protein
MAEKKGLKALAETAEAKRMRMREEKTQSYLDNYPIDPDNWLARLGHRAASSYVLKHPLSESVRTWDTPVNVLGMTYDDLQWISDAQERKKLYDKLKVSNDPLREQVKQETGYDFSKLGNVARRIGLGPQVIGTNDATPEHEFMHRGQMELGVAPSERAPYLYPETVKKPIHNDSTNAATFKDMFGRDPTTEDLKKLASVMAAAKAEYEKRYMSGPGGGMPDAQNPSSAKSESTPPSFMEYLRSFIKKFNAGGIIVDDGNPAKRRKLI